MAQHFLLSSKARSLSIIDIVKMSDMEAFEMFKAIRWNETNGDVVCPCCGTLEKPYFLKTRMQFRCKECFYTFSVTSGTIFANHKLPLQTYLLAIALFTNSVKSISALQLSRDLNVQYKTAWVLSHKIRESLMDYNSDEKFSANGDRGILIPKYDDLDLDYIKFILEPTLRKLAKGRKGDNGEDEFTKVYPSMVEKVIIRIPVLENGNIDLKTQKEISKKYLIIEQIKTFIQEELMKIEKLVISF